MIPSPPLWALRNCTSIILDAQKVQMKLIFVIKFLKSQVKQFKWRLSRDGYQHIYAEL